MRLKEFQIEAVAAARDSLIAGGRGLIVLPTGAGKTVVLGALIRAMHLSHRVIVVQHTRVLNRQNLDTLRAMNPQRTWSVISGETNSGDPASGWRPAHQAGMVLAMAQSLRDGLVERLPPFDYVLVDETHHAVAPAYRAVIEALIARRGGAAGVIGVTATPDRADRRGLDVLFGDEPCFAMSPVELIGAPYHMLVPLAGLTLDSAVLAAASTRLDALAASDEDDEAAAAAVDVKVVNEEIVRLWRTHAADRATVAFCETKAHAASLAAAWRAAGVSAEAVDDTMPARRRDRLLTDFAAGRGPQVLTNPVLLTEGFDAPRLSCVVLARRFASRPLLIQAVGRAARVASGKRDGLVLDMVGALPRHESVLAGYDLSTVPARPALAKRRCDGAPAEPRATAWIGLGEAALAPYDVYAGALEAADLAAPAFADGVPAPPEPVDVARPRSACGREIVSKGEALSMGLVTYFTGRPCARGHVAERYVSGGECVECGREYDRARRKDPAVREKEREYSRARWSDPAVRERRREYDRARRNDPAVREKKREQDRARWNDPAVREKHREYDRARWSDPAAREKKREYDRARYQANKAAKAAADVGAEGTP